MLHFSPSKESTSEMSDVISLVNECSELEAINAISPLQGRLFSLYEHFNKPGAGHLIVDYPQKDNLALCFAFLLQYDWIHDPDIREVWAENGFYCIMKHLQTQTGGKQGQAEAMIILFTLLCAGRNSLKPKIQNILNKGRIVGNPVFHEDDYRLGAQHILDQIALMTASGLRDLGPQAAQIVGTVAEKYNGLQFFSETIQRRDLMKYNPMDVFNKMIFISTVIESILNDM